MNQKLILSLMSSQASKKTGWRGMTEKELEARQRLRIQQLNQLTKVLGPVVYSPLWGHRILGIWRTCKFSLPKNNTHMHMCIKFDLQ